MNTKRVVAILRKKYPGKNIVLNKNKQGKITEILCEIEPTTEHPEYSVAIAVVDKIQPHYHKATTEVYEVFKGKLKVFKDNNEFVLEAREKVTINPGEVHWAEGDETWFKATSSPGWKLEDHLLVKQNE